MTRSSYREAQVTRYTTTTRTAVREAGHVSSAKRKGGTRERQTPAAPTGGRASQWRCRQHPPQPRPSPVRAPSPPSTPAVLQPTGPNRARPASSAPSSMEALGGHWAPGRVSKAPSVLKMLQLRTGLSLPHCETQFPVPTVRPP